MKPIRRPRSSSAPKVYSDEWVEEQVQRLRDGYIDNDSLTGIRLSINRLFQKLADLWAGRYGVSASVALWNGTEEIVKLSFELKPTGGEFGFFIHRALKGSKGKQRHTHGIHEASEKEMAAIFDGKELKLLELEKNLENVKSAEQAAWMNRHAQLLARIEGAKEEKETDG